MMQETTDLKAAQTNFADDACDSSTVPSNVGVQFKKQMEIWNEDSKTFVRTMAAGKITQTVMEKHCIAIIGSFGVGKTAVLRHVAVTMEKDGFYIIPVASVAEIMKYYSSEKKCVFVVDDFCGKFELDTVELEYWRNCFVQVGKNCKIVVACRLQVYLDIKSQGISHIQFHECNLSSSEMCLSEIERLSIAHIYGVDKAKLGENLHLYDCFPRLCSSSKENDCSDFFQNPYFVFKSEIDMLSRGKYCALLLLVLFNNKFQRNYLSWAASNEITEIIENAYDACKIERTNSNRKMLHEFETLIQTFVKREHDTFCALDDNILHLLLTYFSKEKINFLIEYASCDFVQERILLGNLERDKDDFTIVWGKEFNLQRERCNPFEFCEVWNVHGKNTIELSHENREICIKRMIKDWERGNVKGFFQSANCYHKMFYDYLNSLSKSKQQELASKSDKDGTTPLIAICKTPFNTKLTLEIYFHWLLSRGANINASNNEGHTPLISASYHNTIRFVELLALEHADVNRCTNKGCTALYFACQKGYDRVATILIDSGADCNKFSNEGDSPLYAACSVQDTSVESMATYIVRLLLAHGADPNHLTKEGFSPLHAACMFGYVGIVKELLKYKYKADVNIGCINQLLQGFTPLHLACTRYRAAKNETCNDIESITVKKNKTERYIAIVKELLRHGADINKTDIRGISPLVLSGNCPLLLECVKQL